MHWICRAAIVTITLLPSAISQDPPPNLPMQAGTFDQHVHRPYTTTEGLPANDVMAITVDAGGVTAFTSSGAAAFDGSAWRPSNATSGAPATLTEKQTQSIARLAQTTVSIRSVATHDMETAVAADAGLFIGAGNDWAMAMPQQDLVRWAPIDLRAVTYDAEGNLWFAAPQGVGRRTPDGHWALFTGEEGLPYNDFTCMASAPDGGVWFGTTNGAILYQNGEWTFRQGRRWLLDNHVRDIAVDATGNAWIATKAGVSCIATIQTSLQEKAKFYEEEIEKYHRRTEFGYVNPANLSVPGDKSTAKAHYSDNDGHYTGLYLGAVSMAYALTGDPVKKQQADQAFRGLAFLSEVTQGGTHPAPKGFISRVVVPTTDPDPNPDFDLAYDTRRNERDALWKIIQPRWPVDETGKWYWKNDSSSDELDGHFFGYAVYYDRACETEEEKEAVRTVVRRVMDHVIDNGYNMIDYDGKPTRWGHFSPEDLNQNPAWGFERGLNSYSILTYLSIAHHILGDQKYRDEYMRLAIDNGYGMNGLTQPREFMGPGTFGQPDDNMAFINYYHLIRYETDPTLLSMYYRAILRHWSLEKYEKNSFENFVYAACCLGKVRTDHWGETDLTPPPACFEDAIDTLKRYPMDLIEWPMSNAHRIDMVPLGDHLYHNHAAGHRRDGYVFNIDERSEFPWDHDAWVLTTEDDGTVLRPGTPFLLAYYMGRIHGFIAE